MPNDNDINNSPADPQGQSPPQSPAALPAKAQENHLSNSSDIEQMTAKELAREFRWVEGAQLVINGVLAIVGIIALWIYHGQLTAMSGQLDEIRKQYPELQKSADAAKNSADLSKKVLEGADAAIIAFNSLQHTIGENWQVRFANVGKVICPLLEVHFSVVKILVPSQKVIQTFFHESFTRAEILPTKDRDEHDVAYTFAVPGSAHKLQGDTKFTFAIKGDFTYVNGFDRRVSETFCYLLIPAPATENNENQLGGWDTCDDGRNALASRAEAIEEVKRKQAREAK
jgi:hypothetical protein